MRNPRNPFTNLDREVIVSAIVFYLLLCAAMPELSWKWGFTVTILPALLATLLPLCHIKRKGWLR